MASFLIGPVVGEMSLNGSVVLLYSITEQLTLYISPICGAGNREGSKVIICPATYTLDCQSLCPCRLQIDGLEPGTVYSFQWAISNSGTNVYTHSVRMLSPDTSPSVFIISCNRPNLRNGTDLWAEMYRDMTLGDVLVHAGDQVYSDPVVIPLVAPTINRLTLGLISSSSIPSRESVYNDIAKIYQTNWMMQSTRQVLASVSNLMIKDDHEIVDDIIQIRYDKHPAFLIAKRAAIQAYHDFQLALRLTPPEPPSVDDCRNTSELDARSPLSYTVMVGGGAGVHLIDTTVQGFDREASISISLFLTIQGLKRAVISCGMIPLYLSNTSSQTSKLMYGQVPPSMFGQWNPKYSTDILNMLMNFRISNIPEHRVALTGGDWHAAMTGKIILSSDRFAQKYRDLYPNVDFNGCDIDFMVSSAITNICFKADMDNVVNIMNCKGDDALIPEFCVRSNPLLYGTTPKRNYGVVRISSLASFGVENKFGTPATLSARLKTIISFIYAILETAWYAMA